MARLAGGLAALAACAAAVGCNDVPEQCIDVAEPDDRFAVTLAVRDEAGRGIAGARVTAGDVVASTGTDGRAVLDGLSGPAMAIVERSGYLAEPVSLGWGEADRTVEVKLWAAGGGRFALHAAGDVMFGRRYESPVEGAPLIPREDPATGAAEVVAAIAPAFALADLSTVNLETVLSDLPDTAAYPGKRFILRSRPGTVSALHALGVDVVTAANNHARDYLDAGVAETRAAVLAAGIPFIGAGGDDREASEPFRGRAGGTALAIAAYTTVDGTFVNESYPDDGEPRRPGTEAWQTAGRLWSFAGATVSVEEAIRRIGGAWRAFAALEDRAGADLPALWASLTAVYPETQDWVARRGHGGAAAWDASASPAQIAALAADHPLVVVELHAGFQFQEASSENVRVIARRAIDAGADLVVCHHPHVLQGLEWYRGRLIAYSLGNFVFDQDFLSTLASVFLRTVWDGDQLLEARLVPVEIDGYRPAPATGSAARRILETVWERGLLRAESRRGADGGVRAFPIDLDEHTVEADVVIERNSGRIVATGAPTSTRTVAVPAGATVELPLDGLLVPRPLAASGTLEVGRDLFGWGHFEDVLADGDADGATHWALDSCQEAVVWRDAGRGRGALQLRRDLSDGVIVRPVARIPLPRHRLYQPGLPPIPLDPSAAYSVRLLARHRGEAPPFVRVVRYHFDDSDPTEDPESVEIGALELPLAVPDDGAWHEVAVELPDLVDDGANMVMVYVGLGRPRRNQATTLDIDDLRFLEWRDAARLSAAPGAWRFVRSTGDGPASATFEIRR